MYLFSCNNKTLPRPDCRGCPRESLVLVQPCVRLTTGLKQEDETNETFRWKESLLQSGDVLISRSGLVPARPDSSLKSMLVCGNCYCQNKPPQAAKLILTKMHSHESPKIREIQTQSCNTFKWENPLLLQLVVFYQSHDIIALELCAREEFLGTTGARQGQQPAWQELRCDHHLR